MNVLARFSKKQASDSELYLRVFGSEDGLKILADLRRQYDMHTVWPDDPIQMAKLAGAQSVYKKIRGVLMAAKAVRDGRIEIVEEDDHDGRLSIRERS